MIVGKPTYNELCEELTLALVENTKLQLEMVKLKERLKHE